MKETNDYIKILECIESRGYEEGKVVSMNEYCDSTDRNFRRYGKNKEDNYAIIYLNLLNNGVDSYLYLSADKIGEVNVPFTHVYDYKSEMLSKEREILNEQARGYYNKLMEVFNTSKRYDIQIKGLTITASLIRNRQTI